MAGCVEISSDLPCDDGFASYTGDWATAALTCEYTDPATSTVYENDVTFTVECCESQCADTGECIQEMRLTASGSFVNPSTGMPQSVSSAGDCTNVTVDAENGVVTGTASVPLGEYTVTVTFGCS